MIYPRSGGVCGVGGGQVLELKGVRNTFYRP